jgi:hypothetical protein
MNRVSRALSMIRSFFGPLEQTRRVHLSGPRGEHCDAGSLGTLNRNLAGKSHKEDVVIARSLSSDERERYSPAPES